MFFPVLTAKKNYNNIASNKHMAVQRKRVTRFTPRHICWSPARRPTPGRQRGSFGSARPRSGCVTLPALVLKAEKSPADSRLWGKAAAARTGLGWPLQRAGRSIRGTSRGPVPALPPGEKAKGSEAEKHREPKSKHGRVLFSTGKGGPSPAPFPPSGEGPALPRRGWAGAAAASSRSRPAPPAPLTGRLGRGRRPCHAVQVEDGEQVGLRLLQGHPQVLEVVPFLAQQQADEQLGLPAARRLQVAQVAGAEGSGGLQQLHHLVHLSHGLRQALPALGEQFLVLGLHGRCRAAAAAGQTSPAPGSAAPPPPPPGRRGPRRGGRRRPPSSGTRRPRSGPRRNFVRRGGAELVQDLGRGRLCLLLFLLLLQQARGEPPSGAAAPLPPPSGAPFASFPPPRAAKQLLLLLLSPARGRGPLAAEAAGSAAASRHPAPPRGSRDNFSPPLAAATRPGGGAGRRAQLQAPPFIGGRTQPYWLHKAAACAETGLRHRIARPAPPARRSGRRSPGPARPPPAPRPSVRGAPGPRAAPSGAGRGGTRGAACPRFRRSSLRGSAGPGRGARAGCLGGETKAALPRWWRAGAGRAVPLPSPEGGSGRLLRLPESAPGGSFRRQDLFRPKPGKAKRQNSNRVLTDFVH